MWIETTAKMAKEIKLQKKNKKSDAEAKEGKMRGDKEEVKMLSSIGCIFLFRWLNVNTLRSSTSVVGEQRHWTKTNYKVNW